MTTSVSTSGGAVTRWVRYFALAAILCALLSLFSNFSPIRNGVGLVVREQAWQRILSDVLNTALFLALAPVVAWLVTGTKSSAMSCRRGLFLRDFIFGAIACGMGYFVLILSIGSSALAVALTATETLVGLLAAASFALVTGTVEEIALRGGLQYLLLRALRNAPLMILAQGCVFVTLHLSNISGWQGVAYYFCFGGLMSIWALTFRSVWPAVGGHFAINFVSAVMLGDAGRAIQPRITINILNLQALTAVYFVACGLVTVLGEIRRRGDALQPRRDG